MKIETITTVELTGSEVVIENIGNNYANVLNRGAVENYVSAFPDIVADSDGVVPVLAGQSVVVQINGSLYASGNGKITVIGCDEPINFFKCAPSAGGSGEDEEARQAITTHAGNLDIHVTAEEKAGWIGKNTAGITYTVEDTEHTGDVTSEVFNDYENNIAAGTYSHAEGRNTKALKPSSHAEGVYTTASGYNSHAEGSGSIASSQCAHAEGYHTTASGEYSHAEGFNSIASKNHSHAEGYGTEAAADSAHAEGKNTKATSLTAHAEGYGSIASANMAHAEGERTTASSYASHAGGKRNKAMTDSSSLSDNTGDVFVIGNGTASDALSNAFRVTYEGAVYGLSAFNSSGADYAEFIKPWADGNPDGEDRVGYFVTIKDGLLQKANEGDYIVGITSGNPSIIGNSDEDYYWRYERDEFNRFIYEDAEEEVEQTDENGNLVLDENGMPVMVKTGKIIKNAHYKLAADYDPSKQKSYVERKNRPEWSYVGMIGVIPVRDDGTCVAGGFCKCGNDGIATKADVRAFDTFFVIERISENVVSVEMR